MCQRELRVDFETPKIIKYTTYFPFGVDSSFFDGYRLGVCDTINSFHFPMESRRSRFVDGIFYSAVFVFIIFSVCVVENDVWLPCQEVGRVRILNVKDLS